LEIKKWNEIENAFTTKFGWYDGIRHITDISRDILKEKSVYELNEREDYLIINQQRTKDDKETSWQEKEKHK
jgi:hypothetical protein